MVEDVEVILGDMYCIEHDCMEDEEAAHSYKIGYMLMALVIINSLY